MGTIIPFPGGDNNPTRRDGRRFPGLYGKDLGLTDDQVSALISGEREEHTAVFEVAPQIEPGDIDAAPVLRQTIALLTAVHGREPLRATARGNLPVVVVKELFAGAFHDVEPDFIRVNRERDSAVLSRVRRLTQKAGLLSYRNKTFQLTKTGRTTLDSDDFSEIYRKLLEAHLREPQAIDRFDRIPVGTVVAESVPLLLFAARDTTGEHLYEEDFAELILAFCDHIPVRVEDLEHAVSLRFFDRFGVHFGLFEEGPAFEPPFTIPDHTFSAYGRWRRTPLFDRVLHWHTPPPTLAVQRPEAASANLMEAVHESPNKIDGTEDYFVRAICLRAVERCPTDADAYVVLARIYDTHPALALTFVNAGLEATADAVPAVPADVSPWRDHLFRDVIRLHFIRAELLRDLGRLEETFAEFEELLRIDPFDGIGAAGYYFQALMEAGDYQKAQDLLDRFPEVQWSPALWNATLAAYARGDKELADRRRRQAMHANPYVPGHLLSGFPPQAPDYYTPGGMEEALIYAAQFYRTWKRVRGARAWLRRRTAASE